MIWLRNIAHLGFCKSFLNPMINGEFDVIISKFSDILLQFGIAFL